MKKFFRLVSMLAVAGLAFAYTSCTDYSKDIDDNKSQIDAVSSELATAKQQIESLKTDVSNLQTAKSEAEKAISALQTSLTTLQTKHDADVKALNDEISKVKESYAAADEAVKADLQKKIDALNAALKTAEDNHAAEVEKLTKLITSLQDDVKALDTRIASIEETVKTLATKQELSDAKTWAQTTFATKDEVKEVSKTVASLSQTLEAAKKTLAQKDSLLTEEIKALQGKHTEDYNDLISKINEAKNAAANAKTAAEAAQSTADTALSTAQKALGDVTALKAALQEYADSGVLAAKIKLLEATDSANYAKLAEEKLSLAAFDTTFTNALRDAIEKEDGLVTVEIARQIDEAKQELIDKIGALETAVNTKFNALFSISKQLKSLVFVPDLFVDGIEATEYTYAEYNQIETNSTYKESENIIKNDSVYEGVAARIPKGTIKDYKNVLNSKKTADEVYYATPAFAITYKMNPSNADVTNADFSFVSYDKESITSRSSRKNPQASFIKAENGELTVGVGLSSKDILTDKEITNRQNNNLISIFALQATVKNNEGQDTTVTSDFATLYTSRIEFEHLAYKLPGTSVHECNINKQSPICETLADAIEHGPSVSVQYNGTLDLNKIVTTHIKLFRGVETVKFTNTEDPVGVEKDYIAAFPNDEFKVRYEFDEIDYMLDDNLTSETAHVIVENGIVTPCGVTDDGKSDSNKIGSFTSVGRHPIVRVKMFVGDEFVLVGYIKIEILQQTDDLEADPFGDWTYRFHCGGYQNRATWAQMVNKVIEKTGCTKEQFVKLYELETEDNVAVQYYKIGNEFVRADALDKDQKKALGLDKVTVFGSVTEKNENQGTVNTSVLVWKLGDEDLANVYSLKDHKVTIWVLYEYTAGTTTTTHNGIFVPLTAVVHKPVSSVSKKLDEYWFNGGKNAKINLEKPNEKASGDDPTSDWKTNINNVWEGGKPQFAEFDKKYQNGADIEYKYKYYFAPEQETYEINGLYYKLFVDNTNMYDTVLGKNVKDKVKNTEVPAYELSNNITVEAEVKKSIYNNNVLYCTVYAKNDNKTLYKDEDGNTYVKKTIATLDQETGVVTYNYEDGVDNVAKFLLNAYESDRTTQYAESELYAKIGVTAFVDGCNVAMPLKDAIYSYYFLRPINVDAVSGKYFVDGATELQPESNIELFELFTFKDWYGRVFFKEPAGDDDPDYTWLWLFRYYNVKNVEVDLTNVTTDMSGGDITETLLSEKAPYVRLSHLDMSGKKFNSESDLTYSTPMTEKWGETQYKGLRQKFGHLHYSNNTSTSSGDFNIRVPVSFTYTWGTINTHVDIQVKATAPSTSL